MRKQTGYDRLSKQTHQGWFSLLLTILRVALGLLFFLAAMSKMSGWSAERYLQASTGPFADWFISLAGNPLVDQLNLWGQLLIGVALILGLFVRPASFFAALMMILYYLAQFEQNTAHGFIEDHIIYALIFVLFMAGGVGHVLGVDGLIHQRVRKQTWLTKLLFG